MHQEISLISIVKFKKMLQLCFDEAAFPLSAAPISLKKGSAPNSEHTIDLPRALCSTKNSRKTAGLKLYNDGRLQN